MDDVALQIIGGLFLVNGALITAGGVIVSKAIGRVRTDVAGVKHEVMPNEGTSSHDLLAGKITNIEVQVGRCRDDVAESRQDIREVRADIRSTKEENQKAIRAHVTDMH